MDNGAARNGDQNGRRGPGSRHDDGRDNTAVRGLLHDLGHEATTLSYLVEAMHAEPGFPAGARGRLELVSLEVSRLLDIIFHGVPDEHGYDETDLVDVRALAAQVALLASARYRTSVVVRPGPAVNVQANPVLLWRVLSNLVGNAARAASWPRAPKPWGRAEGGAGRACAAGPQGRVEVVIGRAAPRGGAPDIVIDVIDDGPGFRKGPRGTASLGLDVTTSLLRSSGGRFEVLSPAAGGTCVRIALPARLDANAAPGGAGVSAAPAGAGVSVR